MEIVDGAAELWSSSDIIFKVRAPEPVEVGMLNPDKILVSFIWPAQNEELMGELAATGATVLAMDSVPRISRAQKLDALSSMANIAGIGQWLRRPSISVDSSRARSPLQARCLQRKCW